MYSDRLLKDAFEAMKFSLAGIVASASVLYMIFYEQINYIQLDIWYVCVLAVTALRFTLLLFYNKKPSLFSHSNWKNLFTFGVGLSALTWGATPFLFFLPQQYLYQTALIVILSGINAGALTGLSQIYRNIVIFSILLIIPLISVLVMQQTYMHYALAFLIFFYLVLILNVSKKFNRNYIDALEARVLYEKKREELISSEQKFETIFKNVPIGIFFYNTDLQIQEANDNFQHFLNAPKEFLIGLDMSKIKDQRIMPTLKAPLEGIEGFYEGEYNSSYSNSELWISMSTSPLRNSEGKVLGAIGIVSDITQRILSQQQIEHQANYDTLTDIPNRISILREINKELIRFKRHKQIFGVLFLDLDHFKNINDSLGHSIGDDLLIQIAKNLQTAIRVEDIVARIGGDEFVILIPDLGDDEKGAATKVEHVAQKIHQSLSDVFEIQGHTLSISSSIGITLVNEETQSANDLLKHADIAMYQSKKEGRNTTRFYKEEMDIWIKRRLEIENELRHAIAKNELSIHYQPIIEFSTSCVVGAEALLRWENSKLGAIYPDEFIPIAEESGLILDIGKWVLEKAIAQFLVWQQEFSQIKSFKKIAVNVSTYQFNTDGFVQQIKDIVTTSKITPQHLELELTESIIVKDIALIQQKMQALRELGINLSIDDFGTGYSSLSYLKKLPFTTLKIDKSFTQDIQHDADDKELISTIITIAKNFNLEVIIEGVETLDQYLFAHEKRCKHMQGYYCSRPVSAEQFTQMLQEKQGVCDKLG